MGVVAIIIISDMFVRNDSDETGIEKCITIAMRELKVSYLSIKSKS